MCFTCEQKYLQFFVYWQLILNECSSSAPFPDWKLAKKNIHRRHFCSKDKEISRRCRDRRRRKCRRTGSQFYKTFFSSSLIKKPNKLERLSLMSLSRLVSPRNTKGYHCTIDFLFDWFGISCMTTDNFFVFICKTPNPNQLNRRSMVQW